MAQILELVRYSNNETVLALETALALARSKRMRCVAMCFMDDEREEHVVFTGWYRSSTLAASKAVVTMSWQLTQLEIHGHIP
jgi:hypothetical protein